MLALGDIYYSPRGYWKGAAAVKKLADAAKVSEAVARAWLEKQALWQIYLPAPRRIVRPRFDISVPNEVHQADLLFLPHDKVGRKTYKYALTVVDVASRYKEAEPLPSKESKEVASALQRIYKRSPLTWPNLLQVDPGREFMGTVTPLLAKHKTGVRRGRVDIHRDQAIVERFNRTLSERLFGHQYAQELLLPEGERSVEWVRRLPAVVAALNNEVTRLLGEKPALAIKKSLVEASAPRTAPSEQETSFPEMGDLVRYLYEPGELEGGRRRATDPIWSVTTHEIDHSITKVGQPIMYWLRDGPKRSFVREELQVVPWDTELPPKGVL